MGKKFTRKTYSKEEFSELEKLVEKANNENSLASVGRAKVLDYAIGSLSNLRSLLSRMRFLSNFVLKVKPKIYGPHDSEYRFKFDFIRRLYYELSKTELIPSPNLDEAFRECLGSAFIVKRKPRIEQNSDCHRKSKNLE